MNRRNWAHGLQLFERSPCQFNLGDRVYSHSPECDRTFSPCWQGETMLDFLSSTRPTANWIAIAHWPWGRSLKTAEKTQFWSEGRSHDQEKGRLLKTGEIQPTAMSDRTLRGSDHKF